MYGLFMSSALANGQAAAGQAPNPIASFAPFVIIFVIFYFLMIRPQKKRMQQEQAFLNALNKGDEVYTKSGILGKITGITDRIITLEVAEGIKVKILRAQIAGQAKALFEKKEKKEEKKA